MPRYGTGPHDGPLQEQVKRWHEMYLKEAALAKRLREGVSELQEELHKLREENEGNARGLNQWNERYVKERRTNERLREDIEELRGFLEVCYANKKRGDDEIVQVMEERP